MPPLSNSMLWVWKSPRGWHSLGLHQGYSPWHRCLVTVAPMAWTLSQEHEATSAVTTMWSPVVPRVMSGLCLRAIPWRLLPCELLPPWLSPESNGLQRRPFHASQCLNTALLCLLHLWDVAFTRDEPPQAVPGPEMGPAGSACRRGQGIGNRVALDQQKGASPVRERE